jgi:hypothetical protein
MIITRLRSSSYNQFDMCQHSYFLTYVLNFQFPSGKKALLGTCLHKIAETKAYHKLALQNGQSGYEDEIFGWLNIEDLYCDKVAEMCFKHYKESEPFHKWENGDLNLIKKWMRTLFEMNNGAFNPMNQNIIQPEKKFVIEIDKPWAEYRYDLHEQGVVEGKLILQGTVDLIVDHGDDVYEVVDYKSGRRLDWATGEEKDYKKLRYDNQLCIYYYSLCREYPDKQIILTLVFLNDGGAYTLPFERTDLVYCEELIRKRFEKIKSTYKPRLNETWKCKAICPYFKNNHEESGLSLCKHFEKEVNEKGSDQVFIEHGSIKGLSHYEGGGRKDPGQSPEKGSESTT